LALPPPCGNAHRLRRGRPPARLAPIGSEGAKTMTAEPAAQPLRGGPFYDAVPDGTAIEPVRLFAADGAESAGLFYWKGARLPKTVVYLMHPRGDFARHYAIPGLVSAAFGHTSRDLKNGGEASPEGLVGDIAAGMLWARARGVENVGLLGNSG